MCRRVHQSRMQAAGRLCRHLSRQTRLTSRFAARQRGVHSCGSTQRFRPGDRQQHGWPEWVAAAAAAKGTTAAALRMAHPPPLLTDVKRLVPELTAEKYKGQAGKIAVVGGCREYTGAPFFASMAALKIGADLSHVFCTDGAATVIKCYSPELIVHPYLPEWGGRELGEKQQRQLEERATAAIEPWLERFDAVVVGPGLGRDPLVLATVAQVMRRLRELNTPMVVDADGLWLVNQQPELVQGCPNVVLTPNKVEFQRLAGKLGIDPGAEAALEQVCAALAGPVVVRKGGSDVISDGKRTVVCEEEGSLRRAGGQGDVLSGCIATFCAWAQRAGGASKEELHSTSIKGGDTAIGNGSGGGSSSSGGNTSSSGALPPLMLAAYGGCVTTRHASKRAYAKHRRSMGAADLLPELGATVDELFG